MIGITFLEITELLQKLKYPRELNVNPKDFIKLQWITSYKSFLVDEKGPKINILGTIIRPKPLGARPNNVDLSKTTLNEAIRKVKCGCEEL